MHLRAMEKTFLTPTQTISAHRLLGAGYGKGGGYNYEAIKHEKRIPGSILDLKHGPPPPFGGNPPNGMVGEDKSLRTIVQRMLSGDEKEEACLEEGLMAVPLLKHQKIALAWMEKCEKRIECAGGILADDQATINEDNIVDVATLHQQIQQLKNEVQSLRHQGMAKLASNKDANHLEHASVATLLGRFSNDNPLCETKTVGSLVAESLRREQAADNKLKELAKEIEHLNSLVDV